MDKLRGCDFLKIKPFNINEQQLKILDFFYTEFYVLKNHNYFLIRDVYVKINKSIPHLTLRLLLVDLEEKGFIESLKVGGLNNYNRVFRLNIEPQSKGGVYVVARGNYRDY